MPVAEFTTCKETWVVEGLGVVVDRTGFGHMVGEVEIEVVVGEGDSGSVGEGVG